MGDAVQPFIGRFLENVTERDLLGAKELVMLRAWETGSGPRGMEPAGCQVLWCSLLGC